MAYQGDRLKSGREFKAGLVLVAAAIVSAVVSYPEIRYETSGLQEVRGRVTEIDTRSRGRFDGNMLRVVLQTGKGSIRLEQDSAGGYSRALAPGQQIRAWIGEPRDGGNNGPIYPVWQIERGGSVIMPALAVGDNVLDGYLKLCGAMLLLLLGGAFFIIRHLMRFPPGESEQA